MQAGLVLFDPSLPLGDPFALFGALYLQAQQTESVDAAAVALATVSAAGEPSCRMVLLKSVEDGAFVFFTNYESRKARDLDQTRRAALCFHWPILGIQVRVEGTVTRASDAASDAYFASRHRQSQLGAWASSQSRPLDSRQTLLDRFALLDRTYAETAVPRPASWGGYCLRPARIEFWKNAEFRLHDRLLFEQHASGWRTSRLYP